MRENFRGSEVTLRVTLTYIVSLKLPEVFKTLSLSHTHIHRKRQREKKRHRYTKSDRLTYTEIPTHTHKERWRETDRKTNTCIQRQAD